MTIISSLLAAAFNSRKNASASNKRNAPRARILNLEALETRELLDASPIAQLDYPVAEENSAILCDAVLDETAAIDLSNAESEPTTWVVTSVSDSATTKGTLRYALTNAQDGDTITFNASTFKTMKTIELIGTDLPITKSITIIGPKAGVTLDACGACRVFNIADGAGDVSISNITLTNGYSATGSGGGIYSGSSNVLTVDNCVFTNNETAKTSGYYGGAIYANSAVTVTKSSFTGNSGYSGGNAVYVGKSNTLNVSNCQTMQNIAGGSSSVINVTNCDFLNVGTAILGMEGSKITVTGSSFTKNYIAITVAPTSSSAITVSNSVFTSNGSTTTTGHAIYAGNYATVKIENGSEFIGNASSEGGAAVWAGYGANVYVSDSKFDGNASGDSGGAISVSKNTSSIWARLKITNCDFNQNTSGGAGGAVYLNGGAYDRYTPEFTVEDSTFTSNSAKSSGGAVALGDPSGYMSGVIATIKNSSFKSNSALGSGGAINLRVYGYYDNAKTLTIEKSAFTSNVATGDGGAINLYRHSNNSNWRGITASITDATFTSNSAANGGAICNNAASQSLSADKTKLKLTNVSMTGNTASTSGGALYNRVGEFNGTNVLLANNAATNGGGLYHSGMLSYLYNSTIAKNTAKVGGGINNNTRIYLTNSIVAENEGKKDDTIDGPDVWTASGSDTRTMLRTTLVSDASHATGIDVYASGSTNKIGAASAPISAGFVDSANGNYHLTASSVAVNAGNTDLVPEGVVVDLDGNDRVVDDVVDLGAFEYDKPYVPQPIATPQITSTATDVNSITITWKAVPNAERYSVYYKLAGATSWTGVNAKTATTYTITNLESNTEYNVRLMARADGVTYKNSAYTDTLTLKTDIESDDPDPIQLQEPNFTLVPDVKTITVNWTANPNATKYAVYWKLPSATTWTAKTIQLPNTTYTIPNLTVNTTYEVRMRAFGDGTNYTNSALRTSGDQVTTLSDAPKPDPVQLATPTGVDATAKTKTTITVSWNAVANASGYQFIWKNKTDSAYTTVKIDDPTATSYKLSGLDNTATYYWKVMALGDKVDYLNSAYCATQVDMPQQTLDVPTLTVDVGENSATLSWNANAKAASYRIMYKASTDSGYTTLNVDGGKTASYTLTRLASNTKYFVKVAAIGDGVDYLSSGYTALANFTTSGKPATPVISSVTSTAGTVTVKWGKVANAASYTIVCGSDTYEGVPATATSYTIPDRDPATSYSVTVQAIGATEASDVSAAKTIKTKALTKLATPTLTVSATTGKTATLTWTEPTNGTAAGYMLAYRPSSSASYKTVYVAAGTTSYKLTGLTQSSAYSFKIRAIGDGIETNASAYSAVKAANTTSASSAILDLGEELFDELEDDYEALAANFIAK